MATVALILLDLSPVLLLILLLLLMLLLKDMLNNLLLLFANTYIFFLKEVFTFNGNNHACKYLIYLLFELVEII